MKKKKRFAFEKKKNKLEVRGKATGLKFWGAATKRCQRQEKGFSKQCEGAGPRHLVTWHIPICFSGRVPYYAFPGYAWEPVNRRCRGESLGWK